MKVIKAMCLSCRKKIDLEHKPQWGGFHLTAEIYDRMINECKRCRPIDPQFILVIEDDDVTSRP